MAFSYSDKNFTVVGNLCFVHITTSKVAQLNINIPAAIADRMLVDGFKAFNVTSSADLTESGFVYATVSKGIIKVYPNKEIGYLTFYFPIDSNK